MTPSAAATVLDNPQTIDRLDPQGMTRIIEEFPKQWREALSIARSTDLGPLPTPSRIVVSGMGGSAIGGEMLGSLLARETPIPIMVNKSYTLPATVDEKTLVIALSYSGNTAETLAATRAAQQQGAQIVAVTTGGALGDAASRDQWPVVCIPAGLSPRAALGYTFVPLLVLAERLGLAPGIGSALEETERMLTSMSARFAHGVPTKHNPAKRAALALHGRLPVIYAAEGWPGTAAYRWKCQFNENSNYFAVYNTFPELNHNETVGFDAPADIVRRMHLVLLRDEKDDARIGARIDTTRDLLRPRIDGVTEWYTEGESPLARLMSLIYAGDFVSLYLAFLAGVDPTPIAMIDVLKDRLDSFDVGDPVRSP